MPTQIAIQVLLQIVLPGIFVSDLITKQYKNKTEWLIQVGVAGLTLLFTVLVARWDWFSYYLRFAIPALFVGASVVAYRRTGSAPRARSSRVWWVRYLFSGTLVLALIWLNAAVLRGYVYSGTPVELSFPLRDGTYYVGGGGTSRWLNNHTAFPPQDYALDILQLNVLGNRARGVWPDDLSRYAIYGQPVFSPCTGTIVRAVDGLPDQIPPARDSRNLAGNHVVLACRDVEVLLAHLMQGSVTVQPGQSVAQGDGIGRVGNSGNTTQPHLHLHAERGGPPGEILRGQGVPIVFDGRFLVRNSLVTTN